MRHYSLVVVLAALGTAFGQETNFASGPQYLMNSGSPSFARSISTPSVSLSGPPLQVGANDATSDLRAGADDQTVVTPSPDSTASVDLFPIYYGTASAQSIEISSTEASALNVPVSILDTGVSQLTTAQSLRERGYGVTLVEAASFNREHARHAAHAYTNADIDRLRASQK
jgi:hypothetical protein